MSMLEGFYRQDKYNVWLDAERKKHDSAVKLGKKVCQRCGFCCLMRPCIPMPDELDKIAEFLKMPVKEVVKKYFVCDSYDYDVKFLFSAKETQTDITGTFIQSERTFDEGYCIFFDRKEKKCQIYEVRPMEAKITECWTDEGRAKSFFDPWKTVDLVKRFGVILEEDSDW